MGVLRICSLRFRGHIRRPRFSETPKKSPRGFHVHFGPGRKRLDMPSHAKILRLLESYLEGACYGDPGTSMSSKGHVRIPQSGSKAQKEECFYALYCIKSTTYHTESTTYYIVHTTYRVCVCVCVFLAPNRKADPDRASTRWPL